MASATPSVWAEMWAKSMRYRGYKPRATVPSTAIVSATAMAGLMATGEPMMSSLIHMKTTTLT